MNEFQLRVSRSTWDSLRLGYDLGPAREKLLADATLAPAAVIGEADIEGYHWSRQILTLTMAASARLMAELGAKPDARPDTTLDHRAFAVTVGGSFIYGGVFLFIGSPMALAFPVINPESAGGRIVFVARPAQSVIGDYSSAGQDWNGIRNDAIRLRFKGLGKLIE